MIIYMFNLIFDFIINLLSNFVSSGVGIYFIGIFFGYACWHIVKGFFDV